MDKRLKPVVMASLQLQRAQWPLRSAIPQDCQDVIRKLVKNEGRGREVADEARWLEKSYPAQVVLRFQLGCNAASVHAPAIQACREERQRFAELLLQPTPITL